jgi:hypothetical protein
MTWGSKIAFRFLNNGNVQQLVIDMLPLARAKFGYGTVLTAACDRQGCSAADYYFIITIIIIIILWRSLRFVVLFRKLVCLLLECMQLNFSKEIISFSPHICSSKTLYKR